MPIRYIWFYSCISQNGITEEDLTVVFGSGNTFLQKTKVSSSVYTIGIVQIFGYLAFQTFVQCLPFAYYLPIKFCIFQHFWISLRALFSNFSWARVRQHQHRARSKSEENKRIIAEYTSLLSVHVTQTSDIYSVQILFFWQIFLASTHITNYFCDFFSSNNRYITFKL